MIEAIKWHLYDYIGGYMFLVLALSLFLGFPVGLTLGGLALLFTVAGIGLDLMSVNELFLYADRLWQTAAVNQVLVAVPAFVFMGIMLEKSRVAAELLRALQLILAKVPGGLGLAVTLLGTIMAATTGIIGASVVMLTMMALPAMLDAGYDKRLASGTVASSATLGILIPPSIMLVMMADLMAIPVGDLFLAAVVPGLLLAGLYCVYIIVIGIFKPQRAPRIARASDEIGAANIVRLMLKGFVPPVILITLVLGSIFAGWATPTEAAGIGAFGAMLLAFFNKRLTGRILNDVCVETASISAMIFLIMAGATAFSYTFRALYGEDLILDFISWMDLSHWGFLILLMALIFFLGFFFDWLEITLIVLPVFAPVVASMASEFAPALGIEGLPIADQRAQMLFWFAVIVAVNLQTSFLTPPFGFALFFLKGSAPPEVKITDIYKGIIPFVAIQLVGLALVIAFPQIALSLPRLLD
ncbi:TRAP transporter large permease [Ponticoccus alexandrii]|uniref:TRAP transporter large permease subunit n=1 Tax=Ponticoccus alexandrii TaxID=1943633 RepID=A0ABX7FGD7_9RHOB|nr:TRAP transporter large permease subunit [Ponticoccus alexandrii]QRF69175.1 TRAP transporter large permease subunit [Ponticoccus alexandrii]